MGGSRSASRPKRQSTKSSVSYVESDDDEEFLPSSRAGASSAADNRRSNLRGTSHVEDLGIAKGRRTIIVKHPTRPQVFPMLPPLCPDAIERSLSVTLQISSVALYPALPLGCPKMHSTEHLVFANRADWILASSSSNQYIVVANKFLVQAGRKKDGTTTVAEIYRFVFPCKLGQIVVQFSVGYRKHRFFSGGSLCLFVSCIPLNAQDPPKEFIPKEVPKKVQKESPVAEKVEASRRKYVEVSGSEDEDENENPILQKEYSAFKYLLEAASDARDEEQEEAAPLSVHRPCSEEIKPESPERVQEQEVPFLCLSPYLWILLCL